MFHSRRHPSARDLLLALDDELTPRRRVRLRAHLAACAACQAQMRDIRDTLHEATDAAGVRTPAGAAPNAAARARLRMQLAALACETTARPGVGARRFAPASGLVLAAVAGLLIAVALPSSSIDRAANRGAGIFLRPHAGLTPGATRPVSLAQICGPGRYGQTRPIPPSLHRQVFDSYGADMRRADEYELDYLITPELGGIAEARNLWPQPFAGTEWNAYVKDELELHLHQLVCDGTLDFAAAQREMATDWIEAYKRRFATSAPRRDYAANPLTLADAEFLRAELEERGLLTQATLIDGPALMTLWNAAPR